jgi:FAD synthetase
MLRKRKVLAGGVFNIIHSGHIYFLERARRLGDKLTVVVASDRTVLRSKKKLLLPARERAERVSAFSFVDKAVVGDDDDMMKVVMEEQPDVIALGYDQDEHGIRKMLDRAGFGCEIVRIEKLKGYSTKKITGRKK